MSYIPNNGGASAEAVEAAERNEAAQNDSRTADALSKAEAYKAKFGGTGPGNVGIGEGAITIDHDREIAALNRNVNDAMNELAKHAAPGERPEQTVARIEADQRTAGKAASLAAQMAVAAQTSMAHQLSMRDKALAEAHSAAEDHDFTQMEQSREADLVRLAKNLSQKHGIDMAAGLQLALMKVETDPIEKTLPNFAKMRNQYLANSE